MGTIYQTIQLNDRLSAPMMNMVKATQTMITELQRMQAAGKTAFDPTKLNEMSNYAAKARTQINQTADAIRREAEEQEKTNKKTNEGVTAMRTMAGRVKAVLATYISISGIKMGIGWLKESVEMSNNAAQQQTKLQEVMRAMQGATDDQVESVNRLIKAESQSGVVGGTVQKAGAQQLSTYLHNTDAVKTLIPAMNDLAVQMNGTANTTESMTNIANMMGKVFTGQVGALRRAGISFDENSEKILKNGTEQQKAAELAKVVAQNVGNMNQVMANTPQGQAAQMKNNFAAMRAEIGQKLTPSILEFMKALNQNMPSISKMLDGVVQVAKVGLNIATMLAGIVTRVGDFAANHLGTIMPILGALLGIYAAYNIAKQINIILTGIQAGVEATKAGADAAQIATTYGMTAAQVKFNAALLSCPLTWIVLAIIAAIVVLVILANHFLKAGVSAQTAFGVICGWINVAIQFFVNLGKTAINIFMAIVKGAIALGHNIKTAFMAPINAVKSMFYSLLSTAATVIGAIAQKLNYLPFVNIDVDGLNAAADDYEAKARSSMNDAMGVGEGQYQNIGDAMKDGMSTMNAFQDNWTKKAFHAGAAWGDSKASALKGMKNAISGQGDITKANSALKQMQQAQKGAGNSGKASSDTAKTAANTGKTASHAAKTASNTKKVADKLDITSSDIKYIRDFAEKQSINRISSRTINMSVTNNNTISSEMDLDGVASGLTDLMYAKMESEAEGVA
ncbi:hypothetical protein CXIVA_01700 [Clostridium sp. SY8519]|uniref:hypothetical protein n=1 Tax=Clostridium sp. (strain SY8519) TaxID=1042156 RepID=UPI0002171F70|nr:hypothetical protein [Clostridium sp. SY8519]BAK46137.1 hypothetical protein CXIVA_01700 [Clostridium sp. SY8519]